MTIGDGEDWGRHCNSRDSDTAFARLQLNHSNQVDSGSGTETGRKINVSPQEKS